MVIILEDVQKRIQNIINEIKLKINYHKEKMEQQAGFGAYGEALYHQARKSAFEDMLTMFGQKNIK